VTGHDATGKAIVLMDGPAPNQTTRNTGLVSTLMWATDETPADISGAADRAERESGVAPPPAGSILRVVDFPPLSPDEAARLDQAAIHREMGLDAGHRGAPARHPFTHRTRSIDYAIVLEGEIDMLLDDTEVHLRAGDILVQQGTNHAWVNHSTAVCRVAFVLIDAHEPDGWKPNSGTGPKD
jgi:mannose-6-phosphate isomerase-like protein (cupin superfamily)